MEHITDELIDSVLNEYTGNAESALKMCMGKILTYRMINSITSKIQEEGNRTAQEMKAILSDGDASVEALDDALEKLMSACDDMVTTELMDKVSYDDFEHLMDYFSDMTKVKYIGYFSDLMKQSMLQKEKRDLHEHE